MAKQMLKKSTRKTMDMIANWLLVLAGLNWAIGLFGWNLIQSIVDATFPWVGTIIMSGIGIASLWIGWRMTLGKMFK